MLIRKVFRFEAAHRLIDHPGRCAGIHGHSYKVEVFLEGLPNRNGMVVDFGDMSKVFGKIVDRFDHALILAHNDPIVNDLHVLGSLTVLNPRWIVVPYNPTAEMMAAHLWFKIKVALHAAGLPSHTEVKVRVHETETGWAECDKPLGVPFDRTVYSAEVMGVRAGNGTREGETDE